MDLKEVRCEVQWIHLACDSLVADSCECDTESPGSVLDR